MRVTLFGRASVAQKMEQFENVIQLLVDAGHEVLLNESLYMIQDDLQTQYNVSKINTPDDTIDYVLSLGGDGTMLEAVTWIGDKAIPILGLNFGRLGFLTDTVASFTADTVKRLQEKDLVIDERSMLLWTNPEGEPIRRFPHALNDITIQRASSSSMITIHVTIDGIALNSYWADGLIISTPTGSTGYSLSCGGPIIHPSTKNIVLTPIAPHNLNIRPLILDKGVKIAIEVEARDPQFLATLDTHSVLLDTSRHVEISSSPYITKICRLQNDYFTGAIRDKLYWGIDKRNSHG